MADITTTLEALLKTNGALSAALVDSTTGMLLGKAGTGFDLDVAAAGNTEVVRAKLKTIKALGLEDSIEDILITLTTQYHVIRPLSARPEIFLYLVLDIARSNLALARINVKTADSSLEFGDGML